MDRRKNIDEHPGPLPQIRTDKTGVTFEFSGSVQEGRLVIRCDEHGNVWVRILPIGHNT